MERYSIEAITKKYVKGYGFLLFMRNIFSKHGKQLLDTATKTGPDALATVTKSNRNYRKQNRW